MVKVYLNSVRGSLPDSDGVRLVVIEAQREPVYEGDGIGAATYLRTCVPAGTSVEVRHSRGIRSCMNKPTLWRDVREYE